MSPQNLRLPSTKALLGTEWMSRSQAREVLASSKSGTGVLIDFSGVRFVGPSFLDEVFRVYKNAYPKQPIGWVGASRDLAQRIDCILVANQMRPRKRRK